MAGGIIENIKLSCECGEKPIVTWFYIKGTANRKNYCVKCSNCNRRTNRRNKLKNAIYDWENKKYKNNAERVK